MRRDHPLTTRVVEQKQKEQTWLTDLKDRMTANPEWREHYG